MKGLPNDRNWFPMVFCSECGRYTMHRHLSAKARSRCNLHALVIHLASSTLKQVHHSAGHLYDPDRSKIAWLKSIKNNDTAHLGKENVGLKRLTKMPCDLDIAVIIHDSRLLSGLPT